MPRPQPSLVLNFEILKFDDLYASEIAKIVYQFNLKKLPTNFSHYSTLHILFDISPYSTRHTVNNHIFIPRFATLKFQRSIKFAGAKI